MSKNTLQHSFAPSTKHIYMCLVLGVLWCAFAFLLPATASAAESAVNTTVNTTNTGHIHSSPASVCIDDLNCFVFYLNSTGGLAMASSTDGGLTWPDEDVVDSTNTADVINFAIWYDGWTAPGTTTTYIHIASTDGGLDDVYYIRYDIAARTFSTPALATTQAASCIVATAPCTTSITKASDGRLFMAVADAADRFVVTCTTTCTTAGNWSESASAFTGSLGDDHPILMPVGGNNNVQLVWWDVSNSTIEVNTYSATTSTWIGTTTLATAKDNNTTYGGQLFGMSQSTTTGVTALTLVDDANDYITQDHDINFWTYSTTSGWTARTNTITTASGGLTGAKVAHDNAEGAWYVIYSRLTTIGTPTTGNIYYRKSVDNGVTWSGESAAINDNTDTIYGLTTNYHSNERIGAWWNYTTAPRADQEYYDVVNNIITLTGTYYLDEGLQAGSSADLTIKVAVGTSTPSVHTTTSNSSTGNWQLTVSEGNTIATSSPILVYVDGSTSNRAARITKVLGDPGNISGLDLYKDRLLVTHETAGTSTTITDMSFYDSDDDSDVQYTANASALTVNSGQELHVVSGKHFAPGGAVTVHGNASASLLDGSLHLPGTATFTAGGTTTLAGSLRASTTAIFNMHASGTVFNATTTGKEIIVSQSSLGDVYFDGSGGGWTFGTTSTTTDFTIRNGTVTAPSTVLTITGDYANSGTFVHNSGTTTFFSAAAQAATGTMTGASAFNNVSFIGLNTKTIGANLTASGSVTMNGREPGVDSITSAGNLGTANEYGAGGDATLPLTTAATAEAGNLVVVSVAADNDSIVDGNLNEVVSITDSAGGNTWTKIVEYTNGQGLEADGATVSLWYSVLTYTIASGGTITANFSADKDAKAMGAWEFTLSGSGVTVAATSSEVYDAVVADSMTLTSGLSNGVEYLFIRAIAYEDRAQTLTPTTNYTEFPSPEAVSNGGSGASSITAMGEFDINTFVASEVSNPTVSGGGKDGSSVFVALRASYSSRLTVVAPPQLTIGGNYSKSEATFTHSSGTVTLNGVADQRVSGVATGTSAFSTLVVTNSSATTTFDTSFRAHNFDVSVPAAKLAFVAYGTSTISNLTLSGGVGSEISLRSTVSGTQFKFSVSGTSSDIEYINLKDSSACADNTLNAANSINNGNNSCWTYNDHLVYSGTLYEDDGVTPVTSGKAIAVVFGTSTPSRHSTSTDPSGQWTLSVRYGNTVGTSTPFMVYVDADTSTRAAVVSKAASSTSASGIDLYKNHVIVRHEGTGTTTRMSDLAIYDRDDDEDVPYAVSGNALTVNTGNRLYIWPGKTFNATGTVTVNGNASSNPLDGSLHIGLGATYIPTATTTLAGSFTASSTATYFSTSSLVMNATTTGKIVVAPLTTLGNIIFDGNGGGWTIGTTSTTTDLTILNGTLTAPSSNLIITGSYTNTGTFTHNSGTVTFASSSATTTNAGTAISLTGEEKSPTGGNDSAYGVVYANGYLWVVDNQDDKVYKYNTDGTSASSSFSIAEVGNNARGITYANDHFWIVSTAAVGRVYKYTATGTYTGTSFGMGEGGATDPWGITYADGYFWITDVTNTNLYKYDLDGRYTAVAENIGGGNLLPDGVTYANGHLWVIDNTNNLVTRYTTGGVRLHSFDTGLANPNGVAYGEGYFWIVDQNDDAIYKYKFGQAISGVATGTSAFNNLVFRGDAPKAFANNASTTNLTIETLSGSLTAPQYLSISGNYMNTATSGLYHNWGTTTFNGTSAQTISGLATGTNEFGTLVMSGAGTKALPSYASTTNFVIESGSGAVTAPSGNFSIAGNYRNDGTFTNNGGTTTFSGAWDQVATGTMTGSSAFATVMVTNTGTTTFGSTLTASQRFYASSSATSSRNMVLVFASGATTTLTSATLLGSSTFPIWIRSTTDGTQSLLDLDGPYSLTALNVKDSNACPTGGTTLTSSDVTNAGNNSCWFGDLLISGYLYEGEGVTPVTSGETINVAIGTSTLSVSATTTLASGAWSLSIPGSYAIPTTTPILVWVDGDASVRAAVLTKTKDLGSVGGLDLYKNRVIIRNEAVGNSTSLADAAFYDNDDDTDIQFNASSTARTFTVNAGNQLYIWPSALFTATGTVTVNGNAGASPFDGSLHIASGATYNPIGTTTLAGSFTASSSVTYTASSTMVFNATTTGKVVTIPLSTIGNVIFNGSGGGWTIGTTSTTSDLTITAGTLTAPATTLTVTGHYTNNGTFTHNNGTLIMSSSTAATMYTRFSFDTNASGNANPQGISYKNDIFWITDSTDAEVYKYDTNGTYAGSFDTAASGNTDPRGITYANGFIWVTDDTAAQIYKYTTDGTYTGTSFDTAASGNGAPHGITYANGHFWIADNTDSEVYKYTQDGTYTGISFDTAASGNATPRGITYVNDFLWITDSAVAEVYKYTTDGTYTGISFDTAASGNTNPRGITYVNGFLWITDATSAEVYRYSFGQRLTGTATGTSALNNVTFRGASPKSFGAVATSSASTTNFLIEESSGTVNAPASLSISGSYTNSTTSGFYHNWGTTTFNGTSAQTIAGIATGASAFNNMVFTETGTKALPTNASTTNLIIESGSGAVTAPSGNLTIMGDYRNSGTFTNNSGTTTFGGGGQQTATGTMTGTSAFATLVVTNTATTTFGSTLTASQRFYASTTATSTSLVFAAGASTTLTSATFLGRSASPMNIRSTVDGTQWLLNFDGAYSVSNVNVKDSNACPTGGTLTTGPTIVATGVTDSGNNLCWTQGYVLSGYLYSDEGTTLITSPKVLSIQVSTSTVSQYTATSTDAGAWYFTIPTGNRISSSTPILIYIDNDATVKAALLTKASGTTTPSTDLNLYQNRLIIRHEATSGTTTRVEDMTFYDRDNDADIPYTANGDVFTVNAGTQLYIWPGKSFTATNTVTVNGNASAAATDGSLHLGVGSTYTAGTTTLAGSFTASSTATFTSSTTLVMNATTTGKTIEATSTPLGNITLNSSSGSWTMVGGATTSNFTITNGTVIAPATTLTVTGHYTNNGTFTHNNGTLIMASSTVSTTTYTGFSFDTAGSGAANAYGIAYGEGFFWITDSIDDLVYKYNEDGTYTSTSFSISGSGAADSAGIAYADGFLWVTDTLDSEVYKYTTSGTYTGISFDTAVSGNALPEGITYADGSLWVSDATDSEVYKYTLGGRYTGTSFDTAANGNTAMTGVVYSNGFFWTTDTTADQIYKYTKDGVYTGVSTSITGSGNANPRNIAYARGFLWVLDATDDLVYKYAFAQNISGVATGTSAFNTLTFRGFEEKNIAHNASTTNLIIEESSGGVNAPLNLSISGNYSNATTTGFWHNNGTTTFNGTSAQTMSGAATGFSAFNHVVFSESGTKALPTNASTTDFDIESGSGAVTAPSGYLSIVGDYRNLSAFTHNSGTTTFGGFRAQVATGTMTGTSAFATLVVTNTATTTFGNSVTASQRFYASTTATSTSLVFAAGATTTLTSATFLGRSASPINLRSTTDGTQWLLDLEGTYSILYVNTKDSNACPTGGTAQGGPSITTTGTTDSGNNLCWTQGFLISGSLYEDDGTTLITSPKLLSIQVSTSTVSQYVATSTGLGTWYLTIPTGNRISSSTPILVYVNNDASVRAAVVTKASGTTTPLTGLDLYKDRLILRHEGGVGTTTRVTDMTFYDRDNDADVPYTANGDVFTVNAGTELYIWPGKSFTATNTVTVNGNASSTSATDGSLYIGAGAIYDVAGTTTLAGNFRAAYTANYEASSTLVFNATTTGKTIDVATSTLNNVIFNGSGGGWTIGTTSTTSNLTITNGTVIAPTTTLTVTGHYTNNGTFTHNNGTLIMSSSTATTTYTGVSFDTAAAGAGSPYSITYADGHLWLLASSLSAKVYKYTLTGSYTGTSIDLDAVGNSSPRGITYANGFLWVTDTTDDEVYQYTTNAVYTGVSFDTSDAGSSEPTSIAFASDHFWVADATDDDVYKFDSGGLYTGVSFDVSARISNPNGITYANGFFWIADGNTDEVYKYTMAGSYAGESFDVAAAGSSDPAGITYANGYFWLSDFTDSEVYKYSSQAQLLSGVATGTSALGNITFRGTAPKSFAIATSTGWGASTTNFTIDTNSGTVNASQYLSVSGNYTNNVASGLYHNHGTLTFNGTSAQTISGYATDTSAFNHVTFSESGTKVLPINASTTNFTIESGSGAVTAPGNNLSITGDYTNNGTFTNNSGTVVFGSARSAVFQFASATVDISANGNSVAVGIVYANGYLWVTDQSDAQVYKYTLDGTYTGTSFDTAASGNGSPGGLTYVNGYFWIVDMVDAEVYKYTLDGTYTGTSFDTAASGNGSPGGLTYADGHFWIDDASDAQVYKYTLDGTYTGTSFDTAASGNGSPQGLTYSNGYFWVTDSLDIAVYKYTATGTDTGTSFSISTDGNYATYGITQVGGYFWVIKANGKLHIYSSGDQLISGNMSDSSAFNNISFQGAAPKIFSAATTSRASTTNLTIDITSGTVNAPLNLSISGNYSNATTTGFWHNWGTTTFNGTSAQTISGIATGTSAFANAVFTSAGTKALPTNASTTNFIIESGSGAVTAPSGDLTIMGDYRNSGTFTHNSGTTTFAGLGVQVATGTMTGTSAFNDIEFFALSTTTTTFTLGANASSTNFNIGAYATVTAPTLLSISGNYVNDGRFVAGSGTTTFNGTGAQRLAGIATGTSAFYNLVVANNSASTTFDKSITVSNVFSATQPSTIMVFAAGATTTVSRLNMVGGGAGAEIKLRSLTGGTQYKFIVGNTYTLQYIDARDLNACAGLTLNAYNLVNSGNNSCLNSVAFIISGTLYGDEGTTPITIGETIALVVGTSTPSRHTTTADASGAWTFAMLSGTSIATSTPMLVYVDGDATIKGAAMSKFATQGTDVTGLDIYQNRLILRHEGGVGTTTRVQDMTFYDRDNDADVPYTANGDVFTVNAGTQLYIWPGKSFTATNTVTVNGNASSTSATDGSLYIGAGAIYDVAGTTTLAGNFRAAYTGNYEASSTLVMNATTTGKTINVATSTLNSVIFNGSGGGWTIGTTSTTSNLTITNGTVIAPTTTLTVTGHYTNNGTFTHNSGTVIFSSSTLPISTTGISFDTAASGNSDPKSIAFANGYFWIVDNTKAEVYKYNGSGTYTSTSFDTATSGNGSPYGITYVNGFFYITDRFDGYVYKYTAEGTYTGTGFSLTSNSSSYGITYGDGFFWVVDSDNGQIEKYSLNGTYISNFLTSSIPNPTGVTYANGFLWVLEYATVGEIHKYSLNGSFISSTDILAVGGNTQPWGITYAGGYFWVTDAADTQVYAYTHGQRIIGNLTNTSALNNVIFQGSVAKSLGSFGTSSASTSNISINNSTSLHSPSNLSIAGDYSISTSSIFSHNWGTTTFNGTSAQTISGFATGTSAFNNLVFSNTGTKALPGVAASTTNLTIDATSGTVTASAAMSVASNYLSNGTFVAPSGNLTIDGDYMNNGTFTHNSGTVVFSKTSQDVQYTGTSFDTSGSGNVNPLGATYANGYFWVTDWADTRVYKYTATGTYTGTSFDTAASGNGNPFDITYANGYFWVTDDTDAEVYKYTATGTYTGTSFDTAASGNGSANGITYAGDFLWVTDDADNRVYKYNLDGTYASTSFSTAGSGNSSPVGITYANGYFWVTDLTDFEVYKYTATGTYTGTSFDTATSGNGNPFGINYASGFLWIVDSTDSQIYKYDVGGQFISGTTTDTSAFNNLMFQGAAPKILSVATTSRASTTNLTIEATSGTVNAPTNLSIAGNYSNATTSGFWHNWSTTTFNGTSAQTISGIATGTSAFNNIVIANTSGNGTTTQSVAFTKSASSTGTFTMLASTSVQFAAGATTTIVDLSLQGENGARTWLRSSIPGNPWKLDVSGTQRLVTYVNVADSNACIGDSVTATGDSYDAGGNTCWTFIQPDAAFSSAANQVFALGQATTSISTITLTEDDNPSITAANDIRIRIATTTTRMLWDTTDTTATFGGTASSKVANPVSYEGSGSVLVIPVSSDFTSGDTLTISGLSFRDFTATNSATSTLRLIPGGPTATTSNSLDSQTVTITGSFTLSDHTLGQTSDAISYTNDSDVPFFRFRLAPVGETMTVSSIVFPMTGISRLTDSNITNARLYRDMNSDGEYGAGDTQIGGSGVIVMSGQTGTITFSTSWSATTSMNYIVVVDTTGIRPGDHLRLSLPTANITTTADQTSAVMTVSGSVASVQHIKNGAGSSGGGAIGGDAPDGEDRGGGGAGGGGEIDTNTGGDTLGNETGFRAPSSHGSPESGWTTGGNGYDSDGSYATAASANLRHSYAGFGFSVPGSDTITGIEVKLESSGTTAAGEIEVALSWNGGGSVTTYKTTGTLTGTDAVYELGGPSDTWGRAWTPGETNDGSFQIEVRAQPSSNTVQIDAIRVRVYHQASGGGGGGGGEVLGPTQRYYAYVPGLEGSSQAQVLNTLAWMLWKLTFM